MSQDRTQETIENLKTILAQRGRPYVLGMMIGILARLSRSDYGLYRELRDRAEAARKHNK